MKAPDFIETWTGKSFRPLEPVVADICIEDIAHALSNQCRFSGHTRQHYSVAEHSVRVSALLQRQGHSRRMQLWGLLHDASEAYLVDIPSPLKRSATFAAYRIAEAALMDAVCVRFGLEYEMPREVAEADAILLATEARDLMPYRPHHWEGLAAEPLLATIHPWSSDHAERFFLSRFGELSQ